MKFFYLFIILFSQMTFAQFRREKLLKSRSELRKVSVSVLKARGISSWICTEYENGDTYDGSCIGGFYTCEITIKFPGLNYLGGPEAYALRGDQSLLDFKIKDESKCQEEFLAWQSQNLTKTIEYSYEEGLYRIDYQPHFGSRYCYQVPIVKIKTNLGLYVADWIHRVGSLYLGGDDRYRVLCGDIVP